MYNLTDINKIDYLKEININFNKIKNLSIEINNEDNNEDNLKKNKFK